VEKCSETSAQKIQTPAIIQYKKYNILSLIARVFGDKTDVSVHTYQWGLFQDDVLHNVVEEINWFTAN